MKLIIRAQGFLIASIILVVTLVSAKLDFLVSKLWGFKIAFLPITNDGDIIRGKNLEPDEVFLMALNA